MVLNVFLDVFLDVSSFLEAVLREADGSYWHFPMEFLPLLLKAGDPGHLHASQEIC